MIIWLGVREGGRRAVICVVVGGGVEVLHHYHGHGEDGE